MESEIPNEAPEASRKEILAAMQLCLTDVANVLEREHSWLQTRVKASREIDDETIAHFADTGQWDEAEVAERKGEDNLLLQRSQVDMHLQNLLRAVGYLRRIAAVAGYVDMLPVPVDNGDSGENPE